MTTPKEYTKNLNAGIITPQMLSDCIYSVSARAKNCKFQEHWYNKYTYDYYGNQQTYRYKKEQYYKLKEELLSCLQPVCIHKSQYEAYRRYYSNQDRYYDFSKSDKIIETGYAFDDRNDDPVFYLDVNEDVIKYFLFYDLGTNHTFHTPIDDPAIYDLPIVEIDKIKSHGEDTTDLISMAFVNKILEFVRVHDHKIELTEPEGEMEL